MFYGAAVVIHASLLPGVPCDFIQPCCKTAFKASYFNVMFAFSRLRLFSVRLHTLVLIN